MTILAERPTVPQPIQLNNGTRERLRTADGKEMVRMTITPAIALAWISRGDPNRNLSKTTVDRYVSDMLAGQWHETGDTIKLDKNGNLIDGQHRLHAIHKAGVTLSMWVIRGLDPVVMQVIDTGKSRSFSDVMSMERPGLVHAPTLAAGYALLWRIENDNWNRTPTHADVAKVESAHPSLVDTLKDAHAVKKETKMLPSCASVALFLTRKADPALAKQFEHGFIYGVGMEDGDPRLALRRFFLNDKGGTRTFLRQRGQLGTYFKAWNYWLQGRAIQVIALRSDESLTLPMTAEGAKVALAKSVGVKLMPGARL